MLWVKDSKDCEAIPLMMSLLQYGKEHSEFVILEGILYADWYEPLFKRADELFEEHIFAYYFDLPFEETVRRHQMKENSHKFGKEK